MGKQLSSSAVAKIPCLASGCLGEDRMLILEEVQSSSNLGTILRCAEAFGIKEVLCIMQNPVARAYVRSSIGPIFRLNLSVMESAAAAIAYCKTRGVHVVAATPHCNENLAESVFSFPCAVAVGNEADGLSRE